MSKLVFLEHFCFDKRLQSIDLAIRLPRNELYFTKSSFANDLDCGKILRTLFGAEEAEILSFRLSCVFDLLSLCIV